MRAIKCSVDEALAVVLEPVLESLDGADTLKYRNPTYWTTIKVVAVAYKKSINSSRIK